MHFLILAMFIAAQEVSDAFMFEFALMNKDAFRDCDCWEQWVQSSDSDELSSIEFVCTCGAYLSQQQFRDLYPNGVVGELRWRNPEVGGFYCHDITVAECGEPGGCCSQPTTVEV